MSFLRVASLQLLCGLPTATQPLAFCSVMMLAACFSVMVPPACCSYILHVACFSHNLPLLAPSSAYDLPATSPPSPFPSSLLLATCSLHSILCPLHDPCSYLPQPYPFTTPHLPCSPFLQPPPLCAHASSSASAAPSPCSTILSQPPSVATSPSTQPHTASPTAASTQPRPLLPCPLKIPITPVVSPPQITSPQLNINSYKNSTISELKMPCGSSLSKRVGSSHKYSISQKMLQDVELGIVDCQYYSK